LKYGGCPAQLADEGHAIKTGRVLAVKILQGIQQRAGVVGYGGGRQLSFLLQDEIQRFMHGSFIDQKTRHGKPHLQSRQYRYETRD